MSPGPLYLGFDLSTQQLKGKSTITQFKLSYNIIYKTDKGLLTIC